jgi:hypothetical protein
VLGANAEPTSSNMPRKKMPRHGARRCPAASRSKIAETPKIESKVDNETAIDPEKSDDSVSLKVIPFIFWRSHSKRWRLVSR